jgi:hypothetical protein
MYAIFIELYMKRDPFDLNKLGEKVKREINLCKVYSFRIKVENVQ